MRLYLKKSPAQVFVLINLISTYSKLLKNFIYTCFPQIEGYERVPYRVAPFIERIKTGTLRKSSLKI